MANSKKKEKNSKTSEEKKKTSSKKVEKKEEKKDTNKKKDNSKNEKKNIKKEAKKIESISSVDTNISHVVITASCIIIVFCAFYFLTFYITRESRAKDDEEIEVSYKEILLGRSFNISDGSYYVLYYDMSDEDISNKAEEMINSYDPYAKQMPLYTVDMSNSLNKSHASSSSNKGATSASDLVINGITLIEFKDNVIENYYEGEADIGMVLIEGE